MWLSAVSSQRSARNASMTLETCNLKLVTRNHLLFFSLLFDRDLLHTHGANDALVHLFNREDSTRHGDDLSASGQMAKLLHEKRADRLNVLDGKFLFDETFHIEQELSIKDIQS